MGGTVAVTLRKPDGTEYRMDRWTNSMPWGITNLKMLQHDMTHVDAYLEQWLEMKADYDKNNDSANFELNMTDCYFPSEGLAPCGYGLVVVDTVNNAILSMQGYTNFESICAASVGLDIPRGIGDPDSSYECFKEFLEAGKVTGMMTRQSFDNATEDGMGDVYVPVDLTMDEIVAEITGDKRDIYDFRIDLKPFTYEEFDEYEPNALKAMRARILELGFELSDSENKVWDECIKEAIEDYGDEG